MSSVAPPPLITSILNEVPKMSRATAIFRMVLITLILIFALAAFALKSEATEIRNNWDTYRCQPLVLPFASMFGYNTADNFNYCLAGIFKNQAGTFLAPILGVLASLVSIFSTIINSLASVRQIIANIVNSAQSVMLSMRNRIMAVLLELRNSFIRMKQLMYRLFAVFYAIIFMGMSGMNAAVTFGNSTIGQFLDTFCFHPDTLVLTAAGIPLRMQDVTVGTVLMGPTDQCTVTSCMLFDSHALVNKMYSIWGVIVSGNHRVIHNDNWIAVAEHPDAEKIEWDVTMPVICFNTTDNTIPVPIASPDNSWLIFTDFDEDNDADEAAMLISENILGPRGAVALQQTVSSYTLGIGPNTRIRMQTGWKAANDICIGDITAHGKVIGIVNELCPDCVLLHNEILVSAALMIWSVAARGYVRACRLQEIESGPISILRNFVIEGGMYEILTESGGSLFVRDYIECVDNQQAYEDKLNKK